MLDLQVIPVLSTLTLTYFHFTHRCLRDCEILLVLKGCVSVILLVMLAHSGWLDGWIRVLAG
jgi:hypothetical protein